MWVEFHSKAHGVWWMSWNIIKKKHEKSSKRPWTQTHTGDSAMKPYGLAWGEGWSSERTDIMPKQQWPRNSMEMRDKTLKADTGHRQSSQDTFPRHSTFLLSGSWLQNNIFSSDSSHPLLRDKFFISTIQGFGPVKYLLACEVEKCHCTWLVFWKGWNFWTEIKIWKMESAIHRPYFVQLLYYLSVIYKWGSF